VAMDHHRHRRPFRIRIELSPKLYHFRIQGCLERALHAAGALVHGPKLRRRHGHINMSSRLFFFCRSAAGAFLSDEKVKRQ